jgi:DNA-binding transcriptional MerR regulator
LEKKKGKHFMNKRERQKKKLLSIGEMSKYTGAGIKALRYYDEINILKPAYVDPYTEFRYYTFNQTYLVSLIMFCVELDIPLKELTQFIDGQDIVDFRAFLARGKEVAQKKMETIEKGVRLIDLIEQDIGLTEEHSSGQIYIRKIPEKFFHVIPCTQTFENMDQYEMSKLFFDVPYSEEDDLIEYGFLCEYTPLDIKRYVFMELPKHEARENIKIIPAGTYYCKQSEESQIGQSSEIFKDYLAGKNSFIAIETEVFAGKFSINKPLNELRVLAL